MNATAHESAPTKSHGAISPASAEALELMPLLRVIAELAATDLGAEQVLALRPTGHAEELAQRRKRYVEAARLVADRRLVGGFEQPLGLLLERLETDRPPFDGAALLELATLLRATAEARQRIASATPPASGLAALAGLPTPEGDPNREPQAEPFNPFAEIDELRRRIEKTLDRRGRVRDDASPKLTALRGRIRKARDQIYRDLKGVVEKQSEHLSEDTIPMRGGRLVLMLNSGARGRLPGLVHGKSGTGRSFYFEPLGVVEANNTLQEAVEEEDAERARILGEMIVEARRLSLDLESQARFLAELDLLQAAYLFSQTADARLADLATPGSLRLVEARHPLLDPKLAALRKRALGEAGHDAPIEALHLSLGEPTAGSDRGETGEGSEDERSNDRLLVVTGPNAGGKTVSLKTLGLLAAAHQCGLPVPVEAGSALPAFDRIIAAVGDEQDLLSDRSTFSGRLLRLDEAWREARSNSLVLLDELGSGTDPEEGAALSIALLEGLLERKCLGLLTTHLTPLAAAALELPGAACAAMEFDAETGAPTYRLIPGPPGGSEAIALARRLGLPGEWLDRAEAKLGPEHRDLQRLLSEVEELRHELQRERAELEARTRDAEILRQRMEEGEQALVEEKRKIGKRLSQQLESFRRETREALRAEVERITAAVEDGRRKGLAAEAEKRLFAEAPTLPVEREELPEAPVEVGGTVRHRQLGWQGTLEKLSGDKAEVQVRGKKLRCKLDELAGVPTSGKAKTKTAKPSPGNAGPTRATDSADLGIEERVGTEINLIGHRVEPAIEQLDAYLDQALLDSHQALRVIHGFGTGRLRKAVRSHLRRHPAVAKLRPGAANEGGDGATVVTLRG